MKYYEYIGKELFRKYGINTPQGRIASSPAEAVTAAKDVGGAYVLKTQVLRGKRGKAGGIFFGENPEDAGSLSAKLFELKFDGEPVEKVLVEQKISIDQEIYLSIAVDGPRRRPVVLASVHGGMDIEEVAEEDIVRYYIDVTIGLLPYAGREIARRLGLSGSRSLEFADLVCRLYNLFRSIDAELVEINPLALCGEKLIAADAKITIDDEAVKRHPDLPVVAEGSELEQQAQAYDLAFVELGGDIAVMANGAGITMATLDILQQYGGQAANFLDAGGGSNVEQTARALELMLATKPKAVFINIFGGITRCDDVARAFVQVKESQNIKIPVVIRLTGTNDEEGRQILEQCGITAYRDMREAAKRAVELAKEVQ